jgi:hypothetical protein
VELIDAVVAGLEEADPRPLDPGWMQEIQRRSAEYDAGLVAPMTWAEVQGQLRKDAEGG